MLAMFSGTSFVPNMQDEGTCGVTDWGTGISGQMYPAADTLKCLLTDTRGRGQNKKGVSGRQVMTPLQKAEKSAGKQLKM